MTRPCYNATRCCIPFPLPLADFPHTLTLYSVHQQAVNLCTGDDRWLALVTPQVGLGPFHLEVPAPALAGLSVGSPAQLGGTTLDFPDRQINFHHATRWSSTLPAQPPLPSIATHEWLCANQYWLHSPLWSSPTTTLTRMAHQGWDALQRGVRAADAGQLAAGAAQLAGLGPGLTPAGDDFLLGWLAGIWSGALADTPAWTPQNIGKIIAQVAIPRTTRLSGSWLRYAAVGQFGEPWHALINALRHTAALPRHQAWQRILQSGATSGHDALAGFCRAWGAP